MTAFIVTREKNAVYEAVIAKLAQLGIKRGDSAFNSEVVITIGGDGTILHAAVIAALEWRPLLGINTGRLGFMATLEKDELDKLERLKTGEYTISRRMMLQAEVAGKMHFVLNDVVLHRGTARLPDFVINRNDTEIMKIRADGVIVSTSTGSTAYSLSAGGPIIEPELECFLVTALCPHSLFNRPMIFAPDSRLDIGGQDVYVSFDGQDGIQLHENEKVIITKSKFYLDLIDIDGNSFYNSVHNKLMKPLK
jgi:NAD+ kinase